ncbi:Fic family protein (plasmid) [Acetobacter pasteurianus]|nr:Fic family protein [Acetobacter pasteurianus]
MHIDSYRVDAFHKLASILKSTPEYNHSIAQQSMSYLAVKNKAFVEAWLSNRMEGVHLSLAEAFSYANTKYDLQDNDKSDFLGTFRLILDDNDGMPKANFRSFENRLLNIHAKVFSRRTKKEPGRYKSRPNMAGEYVFVSPQAVRETLRIGYEIGVSLTSPFSRAIYLSFLITEVHPFMDGNGRVSRLIMNDQLSSCGEARIVIPQNLWGWYKLGLKELSCGNGGPERLATTFQLSQIWANAIRWDELRACEDALDEARLSLTSDERLDSWFAKYIPLHTDT